MYSEIMCRRRSSRKQRHQRVWMKMTRLLDTDLTETFILEKVYIFLNAVAVLLKVEVMVILYN